MLGATLDAVQRQQRRRNTMDPTLINALPVEWQSIGTAVFAIFVLIFAAWSKVFGKREPVRAEVKEFAMSGQLADMGPIKELVENTGLIVVENRELIVQLKKQNEHFAKIIDLGVAELERQADEREVANKVEAELQRERERERERERQRSRSQDHN